MRGPNELLIWPMAMILAVVLAFMLMMVAVADCKIPPGTPGDTVCKAELTEADCARFQKVFDKNKINLRILEGCAFGTVADLRKENYVVVLKCVNDQRFIVIVKLAVKHNTKVTVMDVEITDERQLPA